MYTYKYPMQSVTADMVVFHNNEVLLIKRNNEPFKGKFAIPGGHMDETDNNVYEAAERELREETGIKAHKAIKNGTVGVYSEKDRDPRGRYVTIAYYLVFASKPKVNINDEEVKEYKWVDIDKIKEEEMAFDHYEILLDVKNAIIKDSKYVTYLWEKEMFGK